MIAGFTPIPLRRGLAELVDDGSQTRAVGHGLFDLSHPGSVSNLLRRAERAVADSSPLRRVIEVIEQRLMKTKNEL